MDEIVALVGIIIMVIYLTVFLIEFNQKDKKNPTP
jgi:hypothetical protein